MELSHRILRHLSDDVQPDERRSPSDDDSKGPIGLHLLFKPDEPLVDFIFVHGLGGGSQKTWTKHKNPETFWPREWLPRDEAGAFRHVRIHSFGYNSDWASMKETALNFTDFAISLAKFIQYSPEISRGPKTPIVLIAHSMGGLVIKKAYLLTRNDPSMKDLVPRFRCMVFLATPHRGSDSVKKLVQILRYGTVFPSREYVGDLGRNTGAIQAINEDFRHVAGNIQLFSFYETLKTKSIMIVEKDSAILGYPNEQSQSVNADHRDICKYEKQTDPSYILIRNVLASITADLIKEVKPIVSTEQLNQLQSIQTYLGIMEDHEQDLTSLQDAHMEGSCKWLLSKEYFKRWLDDPSRTMRYLWLRGQPGVGKSVLSASVINYLQEQNHRPNFYFFNRGDRVKSTLSGMLCSLAYQIAIVHPAVREKLFELQKRAPGVHVYDDRGIWTKVFLGGIFQINVAQPYYWVIDALDECSNASSFLSLMSKKDSGLPVRILVTSRPSVSLLNKFVELGDNIGVVGEEISPEDTLEDIQKYVNRKSRELPVDDEELRRHIQNDILTKSKGSFLWTKLVMNQLCEAHTVEEIERLVHEPPQAMEEFYRETLATIARSSRDVKLAKAIFMWTICSTRPLSVEELQAALEFDIKEKLLSPRNSIPAICGQLVYIDKHDRIQMIHETARHFMLKKSETITIGEGTGNSRLAEVCLEYLCGSEMASQQSRKRSCTAQPTRKSIFVDYASLAFAEHIRGTSSHNSRVLDLLHQFLTTNVQTWIEYVARTGNLQHLIKAAKNFKHFLDRRAKNYAPLGEAVRALEMWSTDLIRLVAKFGRNLLLAPTSIYGLILPFCPKNSALRQYFGSETRGINVVGLSAPEWDNHLSVMQYAKDVRSTAVAYGPKHFAVGLSIGEIILYNATTCQEAMKFQLAQKVRFLTFCRDGNRLAASSRSEIRIWDTATGDLLHSFQTSDEPLALSFSDGDKGLMTATRGHKVHVYDLNSASEPESYPWLDDEEIDDTEFRRLPIGLLFNEDQTILAIVYKGLPILIWDIEDEAPLGMCERVSHASSRRPSTHLLVIAMVFNPVFKLLAAAYGDGDIAVFDTESQDIRVIVEADAQALACSHDGMTLATGDAFGTIQLRDFESLGLLYTLIAYDDPIHGLAFSTDNLRFVDIRGSKCNVWEPAVLVRARDDDDDQSLSGTAISEGLFRPEEEKASNPAYVVLVTAVACPPDKSVVCVAKDNGAVSIYETRTGKVIKELYSHSHHSNISVIRLAWGSKEGLLASADVSTRLKVWKMSNTSPGVWDTKAQLMDCQLNKVITQILFSPENDLILVSTSSSVTIYRVNGELIRSLDNGSSSTCKWTNHPSNPANIISISSSHAYVYDWNTLTATSSHNLAISPASKNTVRTPNTVLLIPSIGMLAIEMLETGPNVSKSSLYIFSSPSFGPTSSAPTHDANTLAVAPLPHFEALSPRLERLIGIVAPSTLVFLDIDLWVCTIDLQKFDGRSCLRHFFIPYDWLSASGHRVLMDVVGQSDVLAVRNEEVAIVRRGLRVEEKVEL